MPGTNNFLPFNPNASNEESDSAYNADALRSGGIPNGSIFASNLANKLFHQMSWMMAALATAMANKGFNISDANFNNLVGVLSNLMTTADLSALAPKNSPVFTGTPTTPSTPLNDNSGRIPNTASMLAQIAQMIVSKANINSPTFSGAPVTPTPPAGSRSGQIPNCAWFGAEFPVFANAGAGYVVIPAGSGIIINWAQGATQGPSPTEQGGFVNWRLGFPHAVLNCQISMLCGASSAADIWYQLNSVLTSGASYFRQGTGSGPNVSTTPYLLAIGF